MSGTISVDFDQVATSIKLLLAQLDEGAIPTEGNMSKSYGSDYGSAQPFRIEVHNSAAVLSAYVTTIRLVLMESHDAIVATIKDIAAFDSSLSDDTAALIATLDSFSTPVAAPGFTVTKAPNASTSMG